jgi:hypothetical protein
VVGDEVFLDLCSIACGKDAPVAIHLDISSGSFQWNISFIRAAHNWEVDLLALLFNLLYSYKVRQEKKDKLW